MGCEEGVLGERERQERLRAQWWEYSQEQSSEPTLQQESSLQA